MKSTSIRQFLKNALIVVLIIGSLNYLSPIFYGIQELPKIVKSSDYVYPNVPAKNSKPEFTVTWFWTSNYIAKSERMENSLKEFNISYHHTRIIFPYDGQYRTKHSMLALKPFLISQKMQQMETPILFVDADLVFLGYPYIFTSQDSQDIDFMTVNWHWEWGWDVPEVLISSGILYYNNTQICKELLSAWWNCLLWADNVYAPDDQVFDKCYNLHKFYEKVKTKWLTLRGYLAMHDYNLRTNYTIVDHPDHNHAHDDKIRKPVATPRYFMEGGRLIDNRYVLSGYCADKNSYGDPIYKWTLNTTKLNAPVGPDGKRPFFQTSCTEFVISLHMNYLVPLESITIKFADVPIPGSVRLKGTTHGYEKKPVGCFKDEYKDRDLPYYRGQDQQNTPEACSEKCSGFNYFGLQYSLECWCGDSYGKHGEVSCDTSIDCPGDKSFKCGGGSLNTIYKKKSEYHEFKVKPGTTSLVLDTKKFELWKNWLVEMDLPSAQIYEVTPVEDMSKRPAELTTEYDGLEIDFYAHGNTILFAGNVVLRGTLKIVLEEGFIPVKGAKHVIGYHMERSGHFDRVKVSWQSLYSTMESVPPVQVIYEPSSIIIQFV